MNRNDRKSRREFLRKMLAIEDKTRPHHEHLLFFKGLSDWPADW